MRGKWERDPSSFPPPTPTALHPTQILSFQGGGLVTHPIPGAQRHAEAKTLGLIADTVLRPFFSSLSALNSLDFSDGKKTN